MKVGAVARKAWENMDITKSLCCRRLCFSNAASCPHCGEPFQPGALKAKAVAENKAFEMKARVLFLAAFLALPAVLLLVHFQGYPLSTL